MGELKALRVGPYEVVPDRKGHRVYQRSRKGQLVRVRNQRVANAVVERAYELYGANRGRQARSLLRRMIAAIGAFFTSMLNWRVV